MTQVNERPPGDSDARVNLVAAVTPGKPQRELPIRANLRVALGQGRVRHEHVTVLDREVRATAPPDHVPRPETFAVELAENAGPLERFEQHAVELAIAAHRHGSCSRPECGHDPGKDAVALLPVQAAHVERNARLLAKCRLALELHIGAACRRPALLQANPLRIERVDDAAGNRQIAERQLRVERALFIRKRAERGDEIGRQLARHRSNLRRRLDRGLALPRLQRPFPERPFEAVPA